RCSAPCVGFIDLEKYQQDVERAIRFLDGHASEVMQDIEQRMLAASDALDFEQAAVLRDQMAALAKVLQQQSMENAGSEPVDILAVAEAGGNVCVNLAMVRGGRHLGDKAFFPSQARGDSLEEVLTAFVAQHYVDAALPAVLVSSPALTDARLLDLLAEQSESSRPRLLTRPRGIRRVWLEQAQQNAELALARRLTETSAREARTLALAQQLALDTDDAALHALHIECFDISHTSGEATQASCVV